MTRYLMNTLTGSVDTAENWQADKQDWENTHGKDEPWLTKDENMIMVEVMTDKDGWWLKVE